MPTDIRIIHAHDFLKVTPEGRIDLEGSKKLLLEIALVAAPLVNYDLILDTRKAKSEMSISDLWFLAVDLNEKFRQAFPRTQKTAILCPLDRFDHAGFFALCGQNKGFHISAFTSFEEAYGWLIADRT